jgi:hypothetical protein
VCRDSQPPECGHLSPSAPRFLGQNICMCVCVCGGGGVYACLCYYGTSTAPHHTHDSSTPPILLHDPPIHDSSGRLLHDTRVPIQTWRWTVRLHVSSSVWGRTVVEGLFHVLRSHLAAVRVCWQRMNCDYMADFIKCTSMFRPSSHIHTRWSRAVKAVQSRGWQ